jgi:5-methylcytosine-specific restriction endonuclease McrA
MVEATLAHTCRAVSRAEAKAAGDKRYFTGRFCPQGHTVERLVSNGSCLECSGIRRKALRASKPDEDRAYRARYHQANLERRRAESRAWYRRNKQKKQQTEKRRWAAGAAERAEKARVREAARTPPKWQACAKWRANNPDKVRAMWIARRARKAAAEGRHTAGDLAALFEKQKGRCVACRTSLCPGYHADHIIPIVAGGSNWITNIQLLCPTCNRSKGAKHPVEWAQSRGALL